MSQNVDIPPESYQSRVAFDQKSRRPTRHLGGKFGISYRRGDRCRPGSGCSLLVSYDRWGVYVWDDNGQRLACRRFPAHRDSLRGRWQLMPHRRGLALKLGAGVVANSIL